MGKFETLCNEYSSGLQRTKGKTAISGGFPCHLLRLSISPIIVTFPEPETALVGPTERHGGHTPGGG